MIVRDSVRVKTDGKGSIRIVIMRDGNAIAANLEYSFKDGEKPISIAEESSVTIEGNESHNVDSEEGDAKDGK